MAMPANGRLTVEEYIDVQKFSTFREAIKYWASTKSPVPYTLWQSVFYQVRKLYAIKDESVVSNAPLS